ncbi:MULTISPECIES: hypothetical protein [Frankia]|uniref:Uncharacterized protein n=1 Tax=Frankia alni (strain DSM 45986 / CECT 9034 / ACN14a) TaxID=326424 RepID=Q0REG6_FRAAA|nr:MULTISPECIES: hypothetical protein [Frankia]CAJ64144.1 Hypothetical protein FRAAL5511 [Frankia alni ACN14a]
MVRSYQRDEVAPSQRNAIDQVQRKLPVLNSIIFDTVRYGGTTATAPIVLADPQSRQQRDIPGQWQALAAEFTARLEALHDE